MSTLCDDGEHRTRVRGEDTVGRVPRTAVLLLGFGVLVSGCGDSEPLAVPLPAGSSGPVPTGPSPSPAPSAAPAPSSAPLSAFEADPAVQAFRTYLLASAAAINADDPKLPSLVAASTARRAGRHADLYRTELGKHAPGPRPTAVLGVKDVADGRKSLLVCSLETGYVTDAPGGSPVEPRAVLGGKYDMVLEGAVWKVDGSAADKTVTCDGAALPGSPA